MNTSSQSTPLFSAKKGGYLFVRNEPTYIRAATVCMVVFPGGVGCDGGGLLEIKIASCLVVLLYILKHHKETVEILLYHHRICAVCEN